jgi:hypothetical protein
LYFELINDATGNNYVSARTQGGPLTGGTWHLVTVTYDGTSDVTGMKLYIDSIVRNNFTQKNTLSATTVSTNKLFIGRRDTLYFTGLMDDVKIYNYVLTASEIKQEYNQSSAVVMGNPIDTKAGGNETVGFWKFDENTGTITYDISGNSNDFTLGTTTAAPTWTTKGKFGNALSFDGGDYVTRLDDSDFDFASTSSVSVSAWVKHNGAIATNNDYILTKADGTNGGYKLYMDDSGDFCFAIDDDSSWTPDDSACTSAIDYDDSNWHHVTGVKSTTTALNLYVDGLLVASDTSFAATNTIANAGALYVGIDSDGASNGWDGAIDQVKIYNYARTARQIKMDMDNGQPIAYWKLDEPSGSIAYDETSNNFDLTLAASSAAPTRTTGRIGRGLSFDEDSSQYASIADNVALSITGDLTLSAWIKPTSILGLFPITGKWEDANESYLLVQAGDEIRMFIDSESNYVETTDANLSAGNWYHVTATYAAVSQTVTIYVNGSAKSTTTTGTIPTSIGDDAGSLFIGFGKTTGNVNVALQPNAASGKDVTVASWAATWNTGISDKISVDTSVLSGLLKFDLSSIPTAATLNSANLYLYHYAIDGNQAFTINTYSIASGNATWTEGTKNWAVAGAGEPTWNGLAANGSGGVTTTWAGSVGLGTDGTDYESTELGSFNGMSGQAVGTEYATTLTTSRVQDWITTPSTNYGLLIKGIVSNKTGNFCSSDYTTPTQRPKLILNIAGSFYYDGIIDEVKLYNYVRSASEVKLDYAGGAVSFK